MDTFALSSSRFSCNMYEHQRYKRIGRAADMQLRGRFTGFARGQAISPLSPLKTNSPVTSTCMLLLNIIEPTVSPVHTTLCPRLFFLELPRFLVSTKFIFVFFFS